MMDGSEKAMSGFNRRLKTNGRSAILLRSRSSASAVKINRLVLWRGIPIPAMFNFWLAMRFDLASRMSCSRTSHKIERLFIRCIMI